MEENTKLVESLLEKTTEFVKTSIELAKLKAIDKTADIVSTIIPHAIVFMLAAAFMLFVNLGIAFWLGEIIGNTFYGFLVVAGFYGVTGAIIHFFFHRKIKKNIANNIVQQLIK
jgi:fatty acid desaturase